MDPYKVLGVSRSDSDETIKKAYRELVKKYHPDQYGSNPLGDLAAEKLKSINEAYDMIQRERAGKSSSNGAGYNSGYGTGGFNSGYAGSGEFAQVRSYLRAGNLNQAESMLDGMSNRSSAEWNFLKGYILMQKGYYDAGKSHITTAYNMEPNNPEYAAAYAQMNNQGAQYRNFYGGDTSGTDCCSICAAFYCLDCLCSGCR